MLFFPNQKKNSNSCRCFLTPPLDGIDIKTATAAVVVAVVVVVVVVVVPEKKRRKMNH